MARTVHAFAQTKWPVCLTSSKPVRLHGVRDVIEDVINLVAVDEWL